MSTILCLVPSIPFSLVMKMAQIQTSLPRLEWSRFGDRGTYISVLNLNIWHDCGPWEKRCKALREWIALLKPDIIGLQEVLLGKPCIPPLAFSP